MIRFLIIAFLGLSALKGRAQRYSFVNYTTHNGLVQSSITDIKQDQAGNIWIGTTGGLSMFDGRKFTNYDDRQQLQSLYISSILCDSAGLIWIGTGNGLITYDHNSFKTIFQPSKVTQNRVMSVISYKGKNMMFVCNNVIYEIRPDRTIKPFHINNELEKKTEFITYDGTGRLWLTSADSKVFRIIGDKAIEFKKPEFIDREYKNTFRFIRVIGNAGADPYFVSTIGTLCVMGDSLNLFSYKFPAFASPVTGAASFVMQDNDSTMWIGANKGLVKLSGKDSAVRFTKKNGFGNHSVSTIMRDREQNLWIGSTYNGVYKLSNEALFSITPSDTVDLKFIRTITPLDDKTTMLGTWGNGIHVLSGQNIFQVHVKSDGMMSEGSTAFNYITSMLHEGKTTYMCSLGGGIWKIPDGSLAAKEIPVFKTTRQIGQLEKYHDNFILQTIDGECFLLDKNFKIITESQKDTAVHEESYRMEIAKEWIFQISMMGTVNVMDTGFRVIRKNVFPEIVTEISQMVTYGSKLLIATLGDGIFVYDDKLKLTNRIDKKAGLNTNVITSLLVDGNNLYAGTNFGLILIDLQTMQARRIFNENEGMFNWECRRAGIVRISKDAIMIATTNGPYVYYPDRDNTEQLSKGYLTAASFTAEGNSTKIIPITTDERQINIPYEIPYSQNHITIDLKGVSQRAPDNVVYHYQLKGYENKWNISTENIPVEYHNLPAGKFIFNAYIKVNQYTSPLLSISFTIKKPLQSQLWFQLLVLAVVALFLFWFLNLLNKVYQKYIQTRMINELGRTMKRKKLILTSALKETEMHLSTLKESQLNGYKMNGIKDLNYLYLDAELKRMQLLVSTDSITLSEFHGFFDEVFSGNGLHGKNLFQAISDGEKHVPIEKAFDLMEIFSLYILWKRSQNENFLFSINTEIRSNNRLIFRCYNLNSLPAEHASQFDQMMRSALVKLKKEGWSIELIENPESSSMVIVEMEAS